jgi:hypothetical protein
MQKQKKQASALLVAMIVLGLILTAALSISLVSLTEKKSSIGSNRSNIAYQEANSGVEKILLAIKNNSSGTLNDLGTCNSGTIEDNTTEYKLEFKDSTGNILTDCGDNVSDISSVK